MSKSFEGKMIIFSGPSGVGKSTLARHLLDKFSSFSFSTSACTRPIRPGEVDGKHYYFLSETDFRSKIKNDAFVEYEEVYPGQFYGTLKSELQKIWSQNNHVLFDIDVYGALAIKKKFPKKSLSILVMPPDIKTLENRLRQRSTESEEKLLMRLGKAKEELEFSGQFDICLVNDNLDNAKIKAEKEVIKFISNL